MTTALTDALTVRDGYRLLGTVPVAIPVSKVDLAILVEEESHIPDTSRYLMAFIDEGIEDPENLSKLMGLNSSIMEAVVRQAYLSGFVFPLSDGTVSLTAHGRDALGETLKLQVSTDTAEIGIDRVTAKAFLWTEIPYELKSTQAELNKLMEQDEISPIPHPAKPPTLEYVTSRGSGTSEALTQMLERELPPRRLVEVIAIEGNVKRFYRTDALALRVVPLDGGQSEWDFVVGGELSEAHAQGFLKIQGRRQRTLIPEPPAHPLDEFDFALDHRDIQRYDEAVRVSTQDRSELQQRRENLVQRSETAPTGTDTTQLENAIEEISQRLDLSGFDVDSDIPLILEPHDHRPFLLRQIGEAEYRVLLVSPWIKKYAFDDEVENSIRRTLSRGVHVSIRYGYEGQGVDRLVRSRLDRISDDFPNFDHHDLGNSHVKLFAVDDRFVTSGSFNWLSFRGSETRTFRDETTFVVSTRSIIDIEFFKYLEPDVYEATAPPTPQLDPVYSGVLFVEGWTDKEFLELTASTAKRPDLLEGIDIRYEPPGAKAAAGEAIAFSRNFPDTPMIALFDSDEIGQAAARHVRDYSLKGNRSVLSYGSVSKAHRSDVEAEHLFPPELIQRFVDDNGGTAVFDAARKDRKSGNMIFDINRESKVLLVDWLRENLTPEDTDQWITLLTQLRKKMKIDAD